MDRKSQQESPHSPDSLPVLRDRPLSGLGRLVKQAHSAMDTFKEPPPHPQTQISEGLICTDAVLLSLIMCFSLKPSASS